MCKIRAPPNLDLALLQDTPGPDLLDLLALLSGAAPSVDVEALLVHGHASLALTSLNLGQPRLLLLLPHLQLLNHALVVALHLLTLLRGTPRGDTVSCLPTHTGAVRGQGYHTPLRGPGPTWFRTLRTRLESFDFSLK